MLVQNRFPAVRFNGDPKKRSQAPSSLASGSASLNFSTSNLVHRPQVPTQKGNGWFNTIKKNLIKQESASSRMQRQIEESIETQQKERKRVLKDLYYLALAYSHRIELQEMLLDGSFRYYGDRNFAREERILHCPPSVKDLNLSQEIPTYEVGVFKAGKIYEEVMGQYKNHYKLAPMQKRTLKGPAEAATHDDMGDLFTQVRFKVPNGEMPAATQAYPGELGSYFAFKHPARTIRDLNAAERKLLSENMAKRKALETEIEEIKAKRLAPIDQKIAQSKKDLEALVEAVNATSAQPYSDADDSQSFLSFYNV